jgi:hypothetical protein
MTQNTTNSNLGGHFSWHRFKGGPCVELWPTVERKK